MHKQLGIWAAVGLIVIVAAFVQWRSQQNQPAPAFAQRAVTTAMRADLLKLGRAQQFYYSEHNRFGTMDELIASGAVTMKKPGRGIYLFVSEPKDDGFQIWARPQGDEADRWPALVINQRMEIDEIPAAAGKK